MAILKIFDELAADNSRLAKEKILNREKGNVLLQRVIKAALDPYIKYWVAKIPEYTAGKCFPQLTLDQAIDELQDLATRKVTGHAAINHLGWVLQNCSVRDAQVVERIIGHDLRCGTGSIVDKTWPGLIPTFDVMLAHKDTSGITYPAYGQRKMDGGRCHLHYDGVKATAWSRAGNELSLFGVFDESAKYILNPGKTGDGEIVFVREDDPTKFLDRKTSNGLFNKAVKGKLSEKDAQRARFVCWDVVDFSSTIPYDQRLAELNAGFKRAFDAQVDTKIYACHTEIVNNEEEAMAFYEAQIAAKEEGAILKNIKHLWVPKRTKDLGKMKAEEDADLVVVGWYYGEPGKKYEKMLGGLVCQTRDGLIEANVGSGFSDDDRAKDLNSWLGSIVAVTYNQRITSKSNAKESLFLPRYVETRFDKKVANSADELK